MAQDEVEKKMLNETNKEEMKKTNKRVGTNLESKKEENTKKTAVNT